MLPNIVEPLLKDVVTSVTVFLTINLSATTSPLALTLPSIFKVVPSKVNFCSPCTVEEFTEVITLLSPEVLYVFMAALGKLLKLLPSPVIIPKDPVDASTLPKEPVVSIEPVYLLLNIDIKLSPQV